MYIFTFYRCLHVAILNVHSIFTSVRIVHMICSIQCKSIHQRSRWPPVERKKNPGQIFSSACEQNKISEHWECVHAPVMDKQLRKSFALWHCAGLDAVGLGIYPVQERITNFQKLLGLPRTVQPVALVVCGWCHVPPERCWLDTVSSYI